MVLNITELGGKTRPELEHLADHIGIPSSSTLRKQELIFRVLQAQAEEQGILYGGGVLEIVDDGYGFLRKNGFLPQSSDIYCISVPSAKVWPADGG